MKFAVAGLGYVGLSNAVMLSEKYQVSAFDIDENKVIKTNEEYGKFRIDATTDGTVACKDADFIIVATPTDFYEEKNGFDTSSVEDVISLAHRVNPNGFIVIKSTVPVGFTQSVMKKYGIGNCLFSPEFLREGSEISDCFNPSRVVIGRETSGKEFAEKYGEAVKRCIKNNADFLYCSTKEAEAIKLFSNAYLAMRVAFFNELDTFAENNGLDAKAVIKGVSSDKRIGDFYNNPSFGFGGYCLPKDTKQLITDFDRIPQKMFSAVVKSNEKRMDYIADKILSANPGVVGIYRLTMKTGSDNFRSSAVIGLIKRLCDKWVKIIIYEPMIQREIFENTAIVNELDKFKSASDIIIANRYSTELDDVLEKVYTRDIFFKD